MNKLKQCRIGMLVLGSLARVFVMAALVMLCLTWDQDMAVLKWILGLSLGMDVVMIVLSLCVSGRSGNGCPSTLTESDWVSAPEREIISNIMHDLKTPLTAIKGYAQGILDGVAGTPERMNKYVRTIQNKADDMAGLVDELSFFADMYQNNFEYHWQNVNVTDYFSECISQLALDLEMKDISLMYRFAICPSLVICMDGEQLRRVIHNIIGNAVKYIQKENGVVFVHIEETMEELIVRITDNGGGIAREELARIFERFYRTDSSRNSKTGGTGLGLAIAKKIVDEHKGQIWAESEPGKGTRISFSLSKRLAKEKL